MPNNLIIKFDVEFACYRSSDPIITPENGISTAMDEFKISAGSMYEFTASNHDIEARAKPLPLTNPTTAKYAAMAGIHAPQTYSTSDSIRSLVFPISIRSGLAQLDVEIIKATQFAGTGFKQLGKFRLRVQDGGNAEKEVALPLESLDDLAVCTKQIKDRVEALETYGQCGFKVGKKERDVTTMFDIYKNALNAAEAPLLAAENLPAAASATTAQPQATSGNTATPAVRATLSGA
jgi:hypothetical protein